MAAARSGGRCGRAAADRPSGGSHSVRLHARRGCLVAAAAAPAARRSPRRASRRALGEGRDRCRQHRRGASKPRRDLLADAAERIRSNPQNTSDRSARSALAAASGVGRGRAARRWTAEQWRATTRPRSGERLALPHRHAEEVAEGDDLEISGRGPRASTAPRARRHRRSRGRRGGRRARCRVLTGAGERRAARRSGGPRSRRDTPSAARPAPARSRGSRRVAPEHEELHGAKVPGRVRSAARRSRTPEPAVVAQRAAARARRRARAGRIGP